MSETSTEPSSPRARARWQPKHTITLAAIIAVAIVFMPVAASAAGQLVNIADSTNDNRTARVSSNGSLTVEERPGNYSNIVQVEFTGSSGNRRLLHPTASPQRFLISELYAAANSNAGTTMTVTLERWIRSTCTSPSCPSNPTSTAGYARSIMRTVKVPGQQTVQLTFPTPLVGSPQGPVSGTPICLYALVGGPAATTAQVGLSGYSLVD